MNNIDERIWKHAESYRVEGDDGEKFARFLFVNFTDIPPEVADMLTDTDRDVLNLPYMRDKNRVFDVVYDNMEEKMGDVEVEERDRFLVFKPTDQDNG